jgi:7-cyano-7-deazaguanine reductase
MRLEKKYVRNTMKVQFVTRQNIPLGEQSEYPNKYEPGLLFRIARSESRDSIISGDLPFDGCDIWNAWELTWLGANNLPIVATAEFRIPANTPYLIESKSLKLYLNSFSMSQFDNPAAVEVAIANDLTASAGGPVSVLVEPVESTENKPVSRLPGFCLDTLAVECRHWEVDAALLRIESENIVNEELYSHLLRSLCPVTSQPDIGSLAIRYEGPKIDRESLLQYIVSFREHNDFHEACIERMFVDLQERCKTQKLSLYARYQRRGGIDINPFRSNFEKRPRNLRLWRQ